jgi:hypothetical protein
MQAESYEPHPIDTSHVQLSGDVESVLERLAENTHQIWAQERMRAGWRYGPSRDDDRKEHPSLVPYRLLDEAERDYDRAIVRATVEALLALGYRIERN